MNIQAAVDDAITAYIDRERIDALFRNARAYSDSAVIMVLFIVVVLAPSLSASTLAFWAGAVVLPQLLFQWLRYRYRKRDSADKPARQWGWYYAFLLTISGTAWGAGIFVLFDTSQPLLQAFVAMCLAGRATAAMLGLAYFLPALYTFVTPIFLLLTIKYFLLGSIAIAVLWLVFLAYLLVFGHRQARLIIDAVRVRFENLQLVQELQVRHAAEMQARQAAEQASQAKSRFFAAANHDLRQPLHALGLFAQALRQAKTAADRKHTLDEILVSIDSLQNLFESLLDLSRFETGQVQPKYEAVALQSVFDRLHNGFALHAREKRLRLRIRPTSAIVHSDAVLLFRVLSNLLSNALRHTTDGGVLLACRRREQYAEIIVCDTGCGIPREEQQHVFEEFYQVGEHARERGQGAGLGLAIVQRICSLLSLPLVLRSREGRGTWFAIRVPYSRLPTICSSPASALPINLLQNRVIIVVDDDAAVRSGLQAVLRGWGCKVMVAESAEAIIALRSDALPDFIISDLHLRGDDGVTAVQRLRAFYGQNIPAVLITGDIGAGSQQLANQSGILLMHKPVTPMRLRALLCQQFAQLPTTSA